MARRLTGRVSFGRVFGPNAENVLADWDYLTSVLAPGTRTERYGREWRLGPVEIRADAVMGRIGYSRQTGTAAVWDDSKGDFMDRAVLDGQTASFAIARQGLRLAFQFRPPNIKRRSFTGAFEALLNEMSGDDFWTVEPEFEEESFAQWRTEVDVVSQIRVTVRRPNPHYGSRNKVKKIVEGTNAQMVTLIAKAEAGESVNLDDELISEAIQHASVEDKDYGHFTADGLGSDGMVSKYDSRRDGAPDEIRVALPDGRREVPLGVIRRTLDTVNGTESQGADDGSPTTPPLSED